MAGSSDILREYLISLGYKVSESGQKKFVGGLNEVSKVAGFTGKAVLAVAAAIGTMSIAYANQFEKLYYASRFADASVTNLKAISLGFKNVGLSAEQSQSEIASFGFTLANQPWLKNQLNMLGVKTEGRDTVDIYKDLAAQLAKMAPWMASMYSSMFGLNPETMRMVILGLSDMNKGMATSRQINKDMGVDLEKLAKSSKEFKQSLNEIWERIDAIGTYFYSKMIKPMLEGTKELNDILKAYGFGLKPLNPTAKDGQSPNARSDDDLRKLGVSEESIKGLRSSNMDCLKANLSSFWNSTPTLISGQGFDLSKVISSFADPTTPFSSSRLAPNGAPASVGTVPSIGKIEQHNSFTVYGVSDPEEAARIARDEDQKNLTEIIRLMSARSW